MKDETQKAVELLKALPPREFLEAMISIMDFGTRLIQNWSPEDDPDPRAELWMRRKRR